MKFLLDQGLPRSCVAFLAARGIVAEHVGELGMHDAEDVVILEEARQPQSIVVTLDADFHMLLATSGAANPSVIRIRIEGLKGEPLAEILSQVAASVGADLAAGAMVTVTPRRIRVRSLPIVI